MTGRLLIFGPGYVGEAFGRLMKAQGMEVAATARSPEQAQGLRELGFDAVDPADPAALAQALGEVRAILVTAPPGPGGCPGLAVLGPALARAGAFPDWIGYLSTTGVYGDREGGWVDERSAASAHSLEGARRVAAERDWRQTGRGMGLTVTTFRLPGIYGPDRSALDRLREGRAHRVVRPGHVFCRIHRDDITSALAGSLARPRAGAIYNIVDDEPAPGHEVIEYAAGLLSIEPPAVLAEIPPASQRFYEENRRVANALAKAELGWRPAFPDYRAGLDAVMAAHGSDDLSHA